MIQFIGTSFIGVQIVFNDLPIKVQYQPEAYVLKIILYPNLFTSLLIKTNGVLL